MAIDPEQFRQTLGRFPTGVTVVTLKLPDGVPVGSPAEAPHGAVHGITVSSFTSLSLTPPLVGVAIGQKARAHAMLPALARYGVSVLATDQAGVSDHFAGRPVALEGDPFEELDGHPVVKGAAAQLVCVVVNQVPVGDHMFVVGRVDHARATEIGSLAYARGRYGRVELG
jgi:flavin reductase (DIM6/NTAB) family NADH-FMN oxidoreductase RutF